MVTWIKELLWDKAEARALMLAAMTGFGVYSQAPVGRSHWDRIIPALIAAIGTAGATAQSVASREGK